jgi:hypothetical protein
MVLFKTALAEVTTDGISFRPLYNQGIISFFLLLKNPIVLLNSLFLTFMSITTLLRLQVWRGDGVIQVHSRGRT